MTRPPSRSSARAPAPSRGRRRRPVGWSPAETTASSRVWSLDQTTKGTKGPNDRTPTDRPELRASLRHHSFAVTQIIPAPAGFGLDRRRPAERDACSRRLRTERGRPRRRRRIRVHRRRVRRARVGRRRTRSLRGVHPGRRRFPASRTGASRETRGVAARRRKGRDCVALRGDHFRSRVQSRPRLGLVRRRFDGSGRRRRRRARARVRAAFDVPPRERARLPRVVAAARGDDASVIPVAAAGP